MKSTGMVRKIDWLGRIVLPAELREILDIKGNDALEFFVDDTKLMLQKYTPGCIFCGEIQNVTTFQEKHICQQCLNDIKKTT